MADKGTPGDGPSLEMPSLPFGRRKRSGAAEADAPATDSPAAAPSIPETDGPDAPAQAPSARPSAPAQPPSVQKAQPARPPAQETRPAAVSRPAPPTPSPIAESAPGSTRSRDGDVDDSRWRTTPKLPALTGITAALATGAAIGLLGVLLVWLASRGCEAARGTASCGDGPGFLVLVAIVAVLAYLGGMLLRAFGVPDAGSTSLLAVGLTVVLLLVFFTDALFAWWMAIVVPLVAALAYALSWWVTTRVVQTDDEPAPTRL